MPICECHVLTSHRTFATHLTSLHRTFFADRKLHLDLLPLRFFTFFLRLDNPLPISHVADFFELRDHIVSREEDFAAGFAEALVSFALGRPAGFSDRELIEKMVERAKENDYRSREFFHILIQSSTFQSKPRNP